MIARLIRRLFWTHKWVYVDEQPERRVCTVCDRCEVAEYDGWGPLWDRVREGVKARHYPGSEA